MLIRIETIITNDTFIHSFSVKLILLFGTAKSPPCIIFNRTMYCFHHILKLASLFIVFCLGLRYKFHSWRFLVQKQLKHLSGCVSGPSSYQVLEYQINYYGN